MNTVLLMSATEEKGAEDGPSLSHKNIFVTMSLPAYSLSVICASVCMSLYAQNAQQVYMLCSKVVY